MPIRDQNREAHTELVGLSMDDYSAVDQGDNPDAIMAFHKAKEGEEAEGEGKPAPKPEGFFTKLARKLGITKDAAAKEYEPRTYNQIRIGDKVQRELAESRWNLMRSVNSIVESAELGDMGALLNTTVTQAGEHMKELAAQLADASSEKSRAFADVVDAVAESSLSVGDPDVTKRVPFHVALKALEQFDLKTLGTDITAGGGDAAEQPHTEESTMSTKTVPTTGITATAQDVSTDATKAMLARLDALEADNKTLKAQTTATEERAKNAEARANAAESEAQKLRGEKDNEAWTVKARALNLGDDAILADVAEDLRTAYAKSKEAGDRKTQFYAGLAAQKALAAKIQTQLGHAATPVDDENMDTAHGKLTAEARKLMKEKAGLSFENAYVLAGKANAALKKAAIAEGRSRAPRH